MDFVFQTDHKVINVESAKIDNYLDLAKELRKLWNKRVTVMLIVVGALGTVPKGLERELEELEIGRRIDRCWDISEYCEEFWSPMETWCHSDSRESMSAILFLKTRKEGNIIIGKCLKLELGYKLRKNNSFLWTVFFQNLKIYVRKVPMVSVRPYDMVICEFKLQSRIYVHLRTNALGKGMNCLIPPAIG